MLLKVPRNNYKVKCIDSQWAQFYDENELRLEQKEGYSLSVPSVRFGFAYTSCVEDILLVNGGRFREECRHLDVKFKYGMPLDTL